MLSDTVRKRNLCRLITSNGVTNFIHLLTRVASNTEPIIDPLIINIDENSIKAGVLGFSISDHLPIFLCLRKGNREEGKPSLNVPFQ